MPDDLVAELTRRAMTQPRAMSTLYDTYHHDSDDESQPVRSSPPSTKGPALAAALGDAGDIASTQYALAKGGHERNPLLPQNRVGNAAVLGGDALLKQVIIHALGENHPTLARLLGYGTGALGAWTTVHNIRAGQQMK